MTCRHEDAGVGCDVCTDATRPWDQINRAYARHPGECDLCADIIDVGDEIVAGDQDDPYMHADCLTREMAEPT